MAVDMSKIPGAAAVAAQMGPTNPTEADVPKLEHLKALKKIYVQQRMDLLEILTGFDVANTYDVYLDKNSKAAKARWLLAKEQSSCFQRLCCAPCREFDVFVGLPYGNAQQNAIQELTEGTSRHVLPMMRIHRDFTFCCQEWDVYDHKNVHIAHGKADLCNLCYYCPSRFTMTYGAGVPRAGEEFMRVKGPCMCWIECVRHFPCRDPFVFEAEAEGRGSLGKVKNKANGWCKQCFLNTDDYTVRFEPAADEIDRGALVGLTFLLDFVHFGLKQGNKNTRMGGFGG